MTPDVRDRFETIEAKMEKLEARQSELAVKLAALAMAIADQMEVRPPKSQPPSRAAVEKFRAVQALAFEIGDLVGSSRIDMAEIKSRLKTPKNGMPLPKRRT